MRDDQAAPAPSDDSGGPGASVDAHGEATGRQDADVAGTG